MSCPRHGADWKWQTWTLQRSRTYDTDLNTDHSIVIFTSRHQLLSKHDDLGPGRITQDRQKVQGFLRRSVRVGFCSPDLSSFNELCTQADQNMFSKVLNNTDHVLHHLLTPVHNTSHSYSLRLHGHDRELPDRLTHLTDCNFIIGMLFYQVYWHYFTRHIYIFVWVTVFTAFWQWINKRICYVVI